jgi:hypothetical protein
MHLKIHHLLQCAIDIRSSAASTIINYNVVGVRGDSNVSLGPRLLERKGLGIRRLEGGRDGDE